MDRDKDRDKGPAAPAAPDPDSGSSAGRGSTIPESKDGVWITSTPGGSSFEPEEDGPAQDAPAQDAGGPQKET